MLKVGGRQAESLGMIRSVLSLFAKKTAVVAVSGVVILGGATLALAEDGALSDPESEVVEDVCETTGEETDGTDADGADTTDGTESTESTESTEDGCDDTDTTGDTGDTDDGTSDDGDAGDGESDDVDDSEDAEDESGEDDEGDPEELSTLDDAEDTDELIEDEVEESHGEKVSEAARVTCWEADYLAYYGNHGQCVRTFAHGEGLAPEEVAAALAERNAPETTTADDPQMTDAGEETTTAAVAPAVEPGNGKGNSGKGSNGKGKKG